MPTYRGIDKRDIVDSVRRATAYLKRLNLGPATARTIERVLSSVRIDAVDRARTDSELQRAIKDNNLSASLTMFLKVLRFHALTDPPGIGGRAPEALDIYRKLHAWGAFPPGDLPVTSIMEPEFRAHLMPAALKILGDLDGPDEAAAQKRLEDFVAGVREAEREHGDKGDRSRWLVDSVPLIINLSRIGGMENEIRDVLDANPKAASMVPDALDVMLDLDARERTLGVEPAIKPYRLAVGKAPEDEDEREALITQTLERVQKIMQNHLNRGEMLHSAATDQNLQTGDLYVVVFATKNAAQYLAVRVSGEYPVFDQKGNRIPPSSPPHPGSGPRPSP